MTNNELNYLQPPDGTECECTYEGEEFCAECNEGNCRDCVFCLAGKNNEGYYE